MLCLSLGVAWVCMWESRRNNTEKEKKSSKSNHALNYLYVYLYQNLEARGQFQIKQIKYSLRSSTSKKLLLAFSLMLAESELLRELLFSGLDNQFAKAKSRKENLSVAYLYIPCAVWCYTSCVEWFLKDGFKRAVFSMCGLIRISWSNRDLVSNLMDGYDSYIVFHFQSACHLHRQMALSHGYIVCICSMTVH